MRTPTYFLYKYSDFKGVGTVQYEISDNWSIE